MQLLRTDKKEETKLEKGVFTREHTLVVKGVLICMLLVHHVFAQDMIDKYGIDVVTDNTLLFSNIIVFFKVCIAGFAFLTAFGMTRIFQAKEEADCRVLFFVTVKRLVKLMSSVVIIYILAALYKQFVMGESLAIFYGGRWRKTGVILFYMLVDMMGLSDYAKTPMINVTWWYLSYAILLIVAMPFLYMAYKKFRYLLIPVGCLLPYAILKESVFFSILLPPVILGTASAYERWFEGREVSGGKKVIGLVTGCGAVFLSYLFYIYANDTVSYTLSVAIPYLVYRYVSDIPVVNTCLKFLGKHATNIFLVHTFIYYYFYSDFIYSVQKIWYIFPLLLCLSTGVSIAIELFKKITGYNRLVTRALDKIDQYAGSL